MPIELEIKSTRALTGINDIADDLQGEQFRRDMLRATLIVLRDAKKNAPVDTGRLRSGLNSSVERVSFIGRGVSGVIGVENSVEYAAAMELGTTHTKMPPVAALEGWARRHGANPYVVARAILRAGGLKPRHYLKNALEDNETRIVSILGTSVSTIIKSNGF